MTKKLRIYYERKEKDLTQVEVAALIGLSKQGYNHIENGNRKPSWDTQEKLEQFFNIPVRELLAETSEEVKENKNTL